MNSSEDKVKKLTKYVSLLVNYPVNLTAYKEEKEAFDNLVLDSLTPLEKEDILDGVKSVADIGTGGGIPGLVWAIYFPEKEFYLVDSIYKKVDALQFFINKLDLKNVHVFCERAENFAKNYREYFDFATCKALARSDIALEYLTPLVKVGGYISLFKGPFYFRDELLYTKNVLNKLKIMEDKNIEYETGKEKKKRYLILFKKTDSTPKNFPRQTGIPKKHPLGEIL